MMSIVSGYPRGPFRIPSVYIVTGLYPGHYKTSGNPVNFIQDSLPNFHHLLKKLGFNRGGTYSPAWNDPMEGVMESYNQRATLVKDEY